MPAQAVPLALLFFNVGVEIGQLTFIAAVLALGWLIRSAAVRAPDWWPRAAAYGIGSVAAFWVGRAHARDLCVSVVGRLASPAHAEPGDC